MNASIDGPLPPVMVPPWQPAHRAVYAGVGFVAAGGCCAGALLFLGG
jgi:hypothetical protein